MLVYELINPSDPYVFTAKDKETAALVVFGLSYAYGAKSQDGNDDLEIPVFLFAPDHAHEWYQENFGRNPEDALKHHLMDVIEAYESFMLGSFEDKRRYEAALNAIDDPEKKEKFKQEWLDGRTSLNNIGNKAFETAKALRSLL